VNRHVPALGSLRCGTFLQKRRRPVHSPTSFSRLNGERVTYPGRSLLVARGSTDQ
jgi:hypothetical protein